MPRRIEYSPSIRMIEDIHSMNLTLTEDQSKALRDVILLLNPPANVEQALAEVTHWADRYQLAFLTRPMYATPTEQRDNAKMVREATKALIDALFQIDPINHEKLGVGLRNGSDRGVVQTLGTLPPVDFIEGLLGELLTVAYEAECDADASIRKGRPGDPEMTTLVVELCRIFEKTTGRAMNASRSRAYSKSGERVLPTKVGACRSFVSLVLVEVLKQEVNDASLDVDLRYAREVLHPSRGTKRRRFIVT